ncbi:MAG: hypothetical protein JO242_25205, partial [Streptosporangiaceae bacterium]|nr:hypothetical protein [Streptosporangiaceae bacterium]
MNLRALFAAGIAAAAIAAPVAATAVSAAAGTPAARPAALEGTPAPASMASIGGIVPALGTQVRHNVFAPAVNGCREPRCNLGYHRGPVMHAPRIYLVFWGPKWRTSGADYKYITRFYRGLGAPRDNWLKITTQYGDRGGHPRVTGSLVARIYMDRARPPRTV